MPSTTIVLPKDEKDFLICIKATISGSKIIPVRGGRIEGYKHQYSMDLGGKIKIEKEIDTETLSIDDDGFFGCKKAFVAGNKIDIKPWGKIMVFDDGVRIRLENYYVKKK